MSLAARRSCAVAGAGLLAAVLAGCSSSPPGPSGSSGVTVKASDTACVVAETTFMSGTQTFAISNSGSQVTEVFVYAPGDRVVGEVGNIGPSTGKKLTVTLKAGHYQLACKPGMVGAGIRTPIVVKGPSGAASATTSPQLDAAVASYRSLRGGAGEAARGAGQALRRRGGGGRHRQGQVAVRGRAHPLRNDRTGRRVARRSRFAHRRAYRRRGDRPAVDRIPPPGTRPLAADADISSDGPVARQLQADIAKLVDEVQRVDLSADQIATGATMLLSNVATVKIAGEEEHYSRLDLVDAAADVQGAQAAYDALRPIVIATDPNLIAKIDARFATLEQDLAQYGSGASFVLYDSLSKAEVHSLASEVDALIGPMGQLAAALQKA